MMDDRIGYVITGGVTAIVVLTLNSWIENPRRWEMFKKLSGYKTYIGMILLGVLGLLHSFGVIDGTTAGPLYATIGALTGVALRQGVKKSGLT